MKKLLSLVLSLVVMLTYSTSIFAAGPMVTPSATVILPTTIQNDYKIETLEDSDEHQKIQITNIKTGEVEYSESFFKNGKYEYLSTSKEGRNSVENVNGTINITNLDTKEVKIINTKPVVTSTTVVRNMVNNTVVSRIGGWDGTGSRTYNSTNLISNQVSVMVGIVASLCLSKVSSVITGVVTYWISTLFPTLWWYQDHFTDSYDSSHRRCDTYFYGNPDYTDYRGLNTYIYYK